MANTYQHTYEELEKLSKGELAVMHVENGGLMGLSTYRKWRKDELINVILEDEGQAPWPPR